MGMKDSSHCLLIEDEIKMMTATNTTPIYAIASGKGGVGKTSFTVNLATLLAGMGKRVLVFDADIGLANVDVQLGLAPEHDISAVVKGDVPLAHIIVPCDKGFDLIPGRSGYEKSPFMTPLERREILKELRAVSENYDLVLLDVAAGIDAEVLAFTSYADATLLVVTADPSSLTDAYAVVKLMKTKFDKENCQIVMNQAATPSEGKNVFAKLHTAAEKFLGVDLSLIGTIPLDRQFSAAVKAQKIAAIAFPDAEAVKAITAIARKI